MVQWRGEEQNLRQGTVHWETPVDRGEAEHALAVTPEERDVSSVTVEEFLQEQAENSFCRGASKTVGNPDSCFDVYQYGFLVCKSPLERTLQQFVPKRLRAKISYLAHHLRLAGHSGGTRMYYTLRR